MLGDYVPDMRQLSRLGRGAIIPDGTYENFHDGWGGQGAEDHTAHRLEPELGLDEYQRFLAESEARRAEWGFYE